LQEGFGSLEIQTRESLVCCKPSSVGGSGRSLEPQNAGRNGDGDCCAHEISDRNVDSTENWTGGHASCMEAKIMSPLCPCTETLCEAAFKGDD
jgi:hypothetical protein